MITCENDYPVEEDTSIVVADVTDPCDLSIVNRVKVPGITASFLHYNGVLFSCGHSLEIYDASSLPEMTHLSSLPGTRGGFSTIRDDILDILYCTNYEEGICILDVSDLRNPSFLSKCDCDNTAPITEKCGIYGISQIVKRKNFVFVVAMDYAVEKHREALYAYDVSEISNPRKICRLSTTPLRGHGIAICKNMLFVAGFRGFLIIDISYPEDPMLVGEYLLEDRFYVSATVDGEYLFLLGKLLDSPRSSGCLSIYDVSNPIHPLSVVTFEIPTGLPFTAKVKDDIAYLACARGIANVDIHDIEKPKILSTIYNPDPKKQYDGVEIVEVQRETV